MVLGETSAPVGTTREAIKTLFLALSFPEAVADPAECAVVNNCPSVPMAPPEVRASNQPVISLITSPWVPLS